MADLIDVPKCIYHGTKHFFREGVALDLHVFKCARQLTVVPFHKQKHEEFAAIYLDRKAVEEVIAKPPTDDLLDALTPKTSTRSLGDDPFGLLDSPKTSPRGAKGKSLLTDDALAKWITARIELLKEPEPEVRQACTLEPMMEPAIDTAPPSPRDSVPSDENTATAAAAAAAAASASGEGVAAEQGGDDGAAADDDALPPPSQRRRRWSVVGGEDEGEEGDASVLTTLPDPIAEGDEGEGGGEAGGVLSFAEAEPPRQRAGAGVKKLSGDSDAGYLAATPVEHVFDIPRVGVGVDLGASFDAGAEKLAASADALAADRKKAHKFSVAARFALTAFDDLLSRIRNESPEEKAAGKLQRAYRAKKAKVKAQKRLAMQRAKLGLDVPDIPLSPHCSPR